MRRKIDRVARQVITLVSSWRSLATAWLYIGSLLILLTALSAAVTYLNADTRSVVRTTGVVRSIVGCSENIELSVVEVQFRVAGRAIMARRSVPSSAPGMHEGARTVVAYDPRHPQDASFPDLERIPLSSLLFGGAVGVIFVFWGSLMRLGLLAPIDKRQDAAGDTQN